jgi:hypothetical protein
MTTQLHFEAFLDSTVNLKQWKLDQLDSRVIAITNALQNDNVIGPIYKEHIPQGSWAHATIIEPVGVFDEFDADFLLHVEEQVDWDPSHYLRELRAAFKRTSTYKDMVRKKNRCVRVGYANDCHVDVVPSITLANGQQVIMNYAENEFEDTNPDGFTQWMKERDDLTDGNLRKVIRLLKYLRDYKNTFDCKSVILTTLVGGRIQPIDAGTRYADIPTTLVSILVDLDNWLSLYSSMPLIDDPSCPGTSFNHRWTEAKFQNFKSMMSKYRGWAEEAQATSDEDAAVTAWQRMFGDEFVAVEVEIRKAALRTAHRSGMRKSATVVAAPGEEFIEQRGLPFSPRYGATIDARIREVYGARSTTIRSGAPLRPGLSLRFTLKTDTPEPYEVIWKVRNRGEVAASLGQLRGQLVDSNGGKNVRTEHTKYDGDHYVEAYVVKNGRVVASDHHEVHIRVK